MIHKLILTATTVAFWGLAGSAHGATVTYTSSTVPRSVANFGQAASTISVPKGRTKVADIDVVGVQLLAASDSSDQQLTLIGPTIFQRLIVNVGCSSYPAGTNFTLDQQAPGNPFGGAGTCPPSNGTYKPSTSPQSSTPLGDFVGSPSGGTWALNYHDTSAGGSGGTLAGWGLRITHEPLGCILKSGEDEPAKLKKRYRISALCNADSTLTTSRHARRITFPLSGPAQLLSVPITKKAFRRLRKKGNVKIGLTVDDGYGDVISETVKIPIKRKKPASP